MAKRPTRKAARSRPAAKARATRTTRQAVRPTVDRRQHKPETLRLRAIGPAITVDDLQRSLDFYTRVLGFIETERFTGENGELRGVMLRAGVCDVTLSQDDWAKGRHRLKGAAVRLWCETDQDIDALAARIEAAGCTLVQPPADQPWRVRSLSIDDPDGFHLSIFRRLK